MAEIWVLGNVAWDVFTRVAGDLPARPGSPAGMAVAPIRPGGSPANVARALSSAGHHVTLLCRAGTNDSKMVDELRSWGIDTGQMERRGETDHAVVAVGIDGERFIFVLEQAGTPPAPMPVPCDALAGADCVYVGHYGQYEAGLVPFLRRSQALVVTGLPPAPETAWPARVMVGSETDHECWAEATFDDFARCGGPALEWAVVTRGADGATAYGRDRTVTIHPKPARAIDTTGAGDAFAAGLIHGLLEGQDVEAAGRLGATWGAAAVTRMQSVPPRWQELDLR